MRTTINIDEDVLEAAKELARRERRSTGEVISDLARRALTGPAFMPQVAGGKTFHGFRPIPRKADVVVSNELIDRLREDSAY
jgi:hypothetical protein